MRNTAVIIGAGPGGAAAAVRLAQRGIRNVVLLDKDRFPREKTCGSALSPNGLKIADELGIGAEVKRLGYFIHSLVVVTPGKREMHLHHQRGRGGGALRKHFDNLLVERAKAAGRRVPPRASASSELVRDGAGRVVGVRGKDEEILADYVIVRRRRALDLLQRPAAQTHHLDADGLVGGHAVRARHDGDDLRQEPVAALRLDVPRDRHAREHRHLHGRRGPRRPQDRAQRARRCSRSSSRTTSPTRLAARGRSASSRATRSRTRRGSATCTRRRDVVPRRGGPHHAQRDRRGHLPGDAVGRVRRRRGRRRRRRASPRGEGLGALHLALPPALHLRLPDGARAARRDQDAALRRHRAGLQLAVGEEGGDLGGGVGAGRLAPDRSGAAARPRTTPRQKMPSSSAPKTHAAVN